MDHVYQADDAIPESLAMLALAEIAGRGFHYGWHSNRKHPFSHWNLTFGGRHRKNRDAVDDVIPPAIQAVWDHLAREHLPGMTLVRCYANAHTFGTEGYPHRDSPEADDRTIVCYMNPVWKLEWAGETVLFEDGEIVRAVMPKWRRILCFPGAVLHAGRGVSRICPAIRTVLVFKAKAP